MTDEERKTIHKNITQNVTSLAASYPDVDFYYFFPPYSIVWWGRLLNKGMIERQIEAERYVIELILEQPNIHLYSFNNKMEITTDLNNYKDPAHYGQWINSLMLRWMHDGECIITKENYEEYLEEEYKFYLEYDYAEINKQEDYEADFHAAAIVNREICGEIPYNLLDSKYAEISLKSAQLQPDLCDNQLGIICMGSLSREPESEISVSDYVRDIEYIGAKIHVNDIGDHRFLEFYGKKESEHGQPSVFVYNSKGEMAASLTKSYKDLDGEWHQYVIELPKMEGEATVILNGGYVDSVGNENSVYCFSNVTLY